MGHRFQVSGVGCQQRLVEKLRNSGIEKLKFGINRF
jgi:hypothetical protein